MTSPAENDESLIENTETPIEEAPKPHIPMQKVSRFGNQGSKFGKAVMNFNPPNKQRPGRAAGRGR
jgi:hypothetical protein